MSLASHIGRGTGEVPPEEEGRHLSTVWITCPAGHVAATQKASGSQLMCGRCGQELDRQTQLTVPERTPETMRRPSARDRLAKRPAPAQRGSGPREPAARPARPVSSPTSAAPVRCAGCHGVADVPAGSGPDRPRGWLSLSVRVPPEASRTGKPYMFVGQWCGVACLAASVPGLAESERRARQTYQADRPVMPRDDVAQLMRETPRAR